MGWKALKEAFGIDGHIVCVTEKGICIGSGYVHDLATIDAKTGRVIENSAFNNFLRQHYPSLNEASPEQVLALIQAEDTFNASIPVYTYLDGQIIEKHCEELGWPNVTHDGEPMYQNTYSPDRNKVIAWAKRNAALEIKGNQDHIKRLQEQLEEATQQLARAEANQAKLDNDYPGIQGA